MNAALWYRLKAEEMRLHAKAHELAAKASHLDPSANDDEKARDKAWAEKLARAYTSHAARYERIAKETEAREGKSP